MRLKWLAIAALVIVGALAVAAWASGQILAATYLVTGERKVRCIDRQLCVGDPWPSSADKIDGDDHGLTGLFCYRTSETGDWLSLADIAAGRLCQSARYDIELRNRSFRTVIEVRDGRVASIANGPLHVIDP